MNLGIKKTKFSCLPAGRGGRIRLYILVVIIVLGGVNIYLYSLRKSINEFVVYEGELNIWRMEQISLSRQYKANNPTNPQPKFKGY